MYRYLALATVIRLDSTISVYASVIVRLTIRENYDLADIVIATVRFATLSPLNSIASVLAPENPQPSPSRT